VTQLAMTCSFKASIFSLKAMSPPLYKPKAVEKEEQEEKKKRKNVKEEIKQHCCPEKQKKINKGKKKIPVLPFGCKWSTPMVFCHHRAGAWRMLSTLACARMKWPSICNNTISLKSTGSHAGPEHRKQKR
jgi:hypothetical protein